jgi:hypothetical protein
VQELLGSTGFSQHFQPSTVDERPPTPPPPKPLPPAFVHDNPSLRPPQPFEAPVGFMHWDGGYAEAFNNPTFATSMFSSAQRRGEDREVLRGRRRVAPGGLSFGMSRECRWWLTVACCIAGVAVPTTTVTVMCAVCVCGCLCACLCLWMSCAATAVGMVQVATCNPDDIGEREAAMELQRYGPGRRVRMADGSIRCNPASAPPAGVRSRSHGAVPRRPSAAVAAANPAASGGVGSATGRETTATAPTASATAGACAATVSATAGGPNGSAGASSVAHGNDGFKVLRLRGGPAR